MHARAAMAYKKVFQTSAPPIRLLDELFVRLLSDLEIAEAAIRNKDPKTKGIHASRALAILNELIAALDPRPSQEMADNLAALYSFAIARITVGHTTMNDAPLAEARKVLEPIHQAFRQAARAAA